MSLKEKVSELYETLKPLCMESGLCLPWEMHKALRRYTQENADECREWFSDGV